MMGLEMILYNRKEGQKMYALILLLLINSIRAQDEICSCSCCIGRFCNPSYLGSSQFQPCSYQSCDIFCRSTYKQCQIYYLNGEVASQCIPNTATIRPLYNCQCDCCRTGIPTCTTALVGYSETYTCQSSSCSISCATQYPSLCVFDQSGQTIGTCVGLVTTTTTTTTIRTVTGSWLDNTCSCLCCQSGPSCSPNIEVGIATLTAQCSSTACITACQNRYPAACPSTTSLGHTTGVCRSPTSSNTRCRCQCCGLNGCPTYDVNTNAACTSCPSICQQRCGNTQPVTVTCISNQSTKLTLPFLHSFIFLSIILLPLSSIFQ